MSKWRYEVTKRNCEVWDKPQYIQLSNDSVKMADGEIDLWHDDVSDIPTKLVATEFNFIVKGGTYGTKKSKMDLSIFWFFPAKRLGRMFPRHTQQITYKDGDLE